MTAFVSHYPQVRDKTVMKAGVERDREHLLILTQEQRKRNANDTNINLPNVVSRVSATPIRQEASLVSCSFRYFTNLDGLLPER
jgi:hypothetical protein